MSHTPKLSILTSLYQAENHLAAFLQQVQNQPLFAESELILVLNEASRKELELAEHFQRQYSEQVQVHHVGKVETLGASWNRAWQAARAPLLAIWNVDDRRTPGSLQAQVGAMDEHPDWVLCYGDYVIVKKYGQEDGVGRHTPAYSPRFFRRAFPLGGSFWVLRSELHRQLGFFDEQFKVGPDFDFSVRIAERGLKMGRAQGILGYFTDAEQGLSTRDGAQASAVDRTAIQLRYGVYDKVRPAYLDEARRYRLDAVLSFGEWRPLEDYLPGHAASLRWHRPLWILGWVRNRLRDLLRGLGLLEWIYGLQKRYLKREI